MIIEGGSAKDGKMSVINDTEPNPYLNGRDGDRATTDKVLAAVVESGSGYDYWRRPKPRPFIAETRKRLSEEGQHIEAMKTGLMRQGLKIE